MCSTTAGLGVPVSCLLVVSRSCNELSGLLLLSFGGPRCLAPFLLCLPAAFAGGRRSRVGMKSDDLYQRASVVSAVNCRRPYARKLHTSAVTVKLTLRARGEAAMLK